MVIGTAIAFGLMGASMAGSSSSPCLDYTDLSAAYYGVGRHYMTTTPTPAFANTHGQ